MDKIDKKTYKLSIYLLKDEIKSYRSALKEGISIQKEYEFKKEVGVNGKVIIGATKQNTSSWRELLQEGVNSTLPDLENTSNRAIVFFSIEGRIFVLVFGYGLHLIKEEAIDRDFGLKTVLNIIDPDKLLSIDKANLDELTVLTRTQTSRKTNPESFNIDIIKDLLRGITGEPTNQFNTNFGRIITGSEGINFIPKVSFLDIPGSLRELKKAYESKAYKSRFGWIDNLKHERDPQIISNLTDKLILGLQNKDTSYIHLTPPFLIDWDSFEGFSYTPKSETQTEFEISNFYNEKEESLSELSWEKILKLSLYFKFRDDEERTPIPFWRCLNYQTELNDTIYVFALSKWYKVNKKYTAELVDYVKQFEESSLPFIDCTKGMDESTYNIALAKSQKYFRLLDKDLISTDLTRSKIEFCDVISESMEFIHVKFRYSSATLSHLFAQGRISAYALRKDRNFRIKLRKKFSDIKLKKGLIPIESREVKPSNYTITFALIEENRRSFVESLPFFSLLNFRLTAEDLTLLGYIVKVKKIGVT